MKQETKEINVIEINDIKNSIIRLINSIPNEKIKILKVIHKLINRLSNGKNRN